jgi:hypothetical protein
MWKIDETGALRVRTKLLLVDFVVAGNEIFWLKEGNDKPKAKNIFFKK